MLDAFANLRAWRPELKLLIAPRHPERSDAIESLIEKRGFSCIRRSTFDGAQDGDVFLLDTIGELASTFEFATVVFMGGSLVARGGHNILEPARYSKPVIFGPHMENFRDMAHAFLEENAAIQVASANELANAVRRLLSDPTFAESLGQKANAVALKKAGATERAVALIREKLLGPVK